MTPDATLRFARPEPGGHPPKPGAPAQRYADTLTRLHRLETQHAKDLLSGAMMQRRFLTPAGEMHRILRPCGFDAAAFSVSRHTVSGDFISSRALGPESASLLLGDTACNTLSSALLSMRISSLVQLCTTSSPCEFLTQVHDDINGLVSSGHFVTASYVMLSPGQMAIANAGQPMPLLLRGGRTSEINATGIPLGLPLGAGQYRDTILRLHPGDRIILYTDGITAGMASGNNMSRHQLRTLLELYAESELSALVEEISRELRILAAEEPAVQDMSLLAIEYMP